jgi:hypothetical protein
MRRPGLDSRDARREFGPDQQNRAGRVIDDKPAGRSQRTRSQASCHRRDINQHLAEALGAGQPPPLGGHLAETKEHLRGTSHRIGSAAAMVKAARVI